MSWTKYLVESKLIDPPTFVSDDLQFEAVMGSTAFGVSTDQSDRDVYGFCIPPKQLLFPHLLGVIPGFDPEPGRFEQAQLHHIFDANGNEFDVTVYSIVKFFWLALEGNPTLLDTLFVPDDCLSFTTAIGRKVRESRHLFLHRECWKRYRGYTQEMIHKMTIKRPVEGSRRYRLVEEFGYDVKFAAHAVRLTLEGMQILRTGTLDIRANAEVMKEIRSGTWTEARVKAFVIEVEKQGEELYEQGFVVPETKQTGEVKKLLLSCLHEHYGELPQGFS